MLGSTKGNTLQFIIDAIESGSLDAEIRIVISNKEHAYILERARKHHIRALYISQKGKSREEFDQEVSRILALEKIDLVLLIGYMRFLSKEFIGAWRYKVINVHPSLLPKFAGGMDLNIHQQVLDAHERVSGMTIHFVDEGADTGHIILQKECTVDPEETIDSLKAKVQLLEGEGFLEIIPLFAAGKITVRDSQVHIDD